jgi:integrase
LRRNDVKNVAQKPAQSGPEATGTIEARNGRWYGRVRIGGRKRSPWIPLGSTSETSEARAAEKLAALVETGQKNGNLAELIDRLRERTGMRGRTTIATAAPAALSVKDLGEAWTSGKLFKEHGAINGLKVKKSAAEDTYRLRRCYAVHTRGAQGPTFGALAVADVTEQDVEAVMAAAPATWRAATRVQRYAVLRRVFDLAIVPCRVRRDSPVSKYIRPAKGGGKLFSYLYPAELLAVLKRKTIPLGRRVLYALAMYTGLRKGSLFALTWRDVDLTNGVIRALVTKNDEPQSFGLELLGLVDVLSRWRAHLGKPDIDARVVCAADMLPAEAAARLRADLQLAGVARPELFDDTNPKVEPLRFHDCRASFVTWAKRPSLSRSHERDSRSPRAPGDDGSGGPKGGPRSRGNAHLDAMKSAQNADDDAFPAAPREEPGLWIQVSRVQAPLLTPGRGPRHEGLPASIALA